MDRKTVIDRLYDMADYLHKKSYSDLLARDFYDTVGYAIALMKEQEERIKLLEHQLETITRWRANAGAFD